jgi:hypothetical protein
VCVCVDTYLYTCVYTDIRYIHGGWRKLQQIEHGTKKRGERGERGGGRTTDFSSS